MSALSTLLTEIYGTSEKSDWEQLTPSYDGFVGNLQKSVDELTKHPAEKRKAKETIPQKVMSHFGLFIESRFFYNQIKTDPVAGIPREHITVLADAELTWSNLATQPDMSISIQDCHDGSMLYDFARGTVVPKPCHLLGIFEVKHSDPFLNIPFDECRFKAIPSPRFNYIMIYGVGDKDGFELGLYSPLYENPTSSDPNVKRNGVIH